MNSTLDFQPIFTREKVIKASRRFFDDQDFHEVITPTMQAGLPVEPTIYPFVTQWTGVTPHRNFYLSVSPEAGLKRMMAEGVGKCYAIGKCFRNLEGAGSTHNPEFLMMEWYRPDSTFFDIMADLEQLVSFVAEQVHGKAISKLQYQDLELNLATPWLRVSQEELWREHLGWEFSDIVNDEVLLKRAAERGYSTEGATWEQIFDQIMLNEIEPHFPKQPFFLLDFPARLSPLCQVNKDKPYLAERFEAFMAGMEIGNGNNEGTNVEAIRKQFEDEAEFRRSQGHIVPPVDEAFMTALGKINGMGYAGIGLGIDRLAMIMANASSIRQVEYFCV